MKLAITDVESTGLENHHEPIQIAIKKIDGNTTEVFNRLIKPKNPIPEFISNLTGITNEMVADAPYFEEIADEIINFCDGCILVTFNGNGFDVPFLNEKFNLIGKTFPKPGQLHVDASRLYAKAFPRDLKSVYENLTNKPFEELGNAHDAMVDVNATEIAFFKLIENFPDKVGANLEEWVANSKKEGQVDWAGKLFRNPEGIICYAIGKSKGVPVKKDPSFGNWIMNQTWCTADTARWIDSELNDQEDENSADDLPW